LLCFRPVLIELPHIASLHDDEREVIALRSDDGISWHEHPVTASEIVAGLRKFAGELTHSDCCWTKYSFSFQSGNRNIPWCNGFYFWNETQQLHTTPYFELCCGIRLLYLKCAVCVFIMACVCLLINCVFFGLELKRMKSHGFLTIDVKISQSKMHHISQVHDAEQ